MAAGYGEADILEADVYVAWSGTVTSAKLVGDEFNVGWRHDIYLNNALIGQSILRPERLDQRHLLHATSRLDQRMDPSTLAWCGKDSTVSGSRRAPRPEARNPTNGAYQRTTGATG